MSTPVERRRAQAAQRLETQARSIAEWYAGRDPAELAEPSALPGWDVATLGAHVLMMLQGAAEVLERPTRVRPIPLHHYVTRYRTDVEDIDRRTLAVGQTSTDLSADLAAAVDRLARRLAEPWPDGVTAVRGPLRTEDFVASRIIETVVHGDDLNAGDLVVAGRADPVPIDPQALGAATRALAAMLEERYPGRTTEVRMPPYAAVQCGTADHAPSPAHTRGTPPNVIELPPLDFVRLATGRLAWVDAVTAGTVRASGTRADLTEHLPLLS